MFGVTRDWCWPTWRTSQDPKQARQWVMRSAWACTLSFSRNIRKGRVCRLQPSVQKSSPPNCASSLLPVNRWLPGRQEAAGEAGKYHPAPGQSVPVASLSLSLYSIAPQETHLLNCGCLQMTQRSSTPPRMMRGLNESMDFRLIHQLRKPASGAVHPGCFLYLTGWDQPLNRLQQTLKTVD